jgi:hypothetical protein
MCIYLLKLFWSEKFGFQLAGFILSEKVVFQVFGFISELLT